MLFRSSCCCGCVCERPGGCRSNSSGEKLKSSCGCSGGCCFRVALCVVGCLKGKTVYPDHESSIGRKLALAVRKLSTCTVVVDFL